MFLIGYVAYIPVINGRDRNGKPCKRINCSEFWKGRDSYSKLQDEYYDFITNRGYDLERGIKGSTAEHLSVAEYKLKKSSEQLAEIKGQIIEIGIAVQTRLWESTAICLRKQGSNPAML